MTDELSRHILVAIDGSANAKRVLVYLSEIFARREDFEITLISIAPPVPSHLRQAHPAIHEVKRWKLVEEIGAKHFSLAQDIVTRGKEFLVSRGLSLERIHTKAMVQRSDIAKDLLFEARVGKYDAIAVGRRGLSRMAASFMGSVSYKLIQAQSDVPVWLIDGQVINRRYLLAVDLCEDCLKVIDHVGFILAGDQEAEITLYHVIPSFRPFMAHEEEVLLAEIEELIIKKEEERARSFFEEARKILEEGRFSEGQIRVKIKTGSTNVAGDIIHEAQKGNYGTVALGRRGQGGFKEMILGSTSTKVIFGLMDRTIWVVA
ncbi:universal stress protein [Thermosulfuriphilus sp.]